MTPDPTQRDPQLAAARPPSSALSATGRMKILLIDDDVDAGEAVQDLLERTWEVDVIIAVTAGEAQGLLEQPTEGNGAPFDLIVLDVGLPDLLSLIHI